MTDPIAAAIDHIRSITADGPWTPRRVAQDEIARLTAERDQALARLAAVHLEAIERCAALLIELGHVSESGETLANEVRGLRVDSDAQAALDKMLAEARLEGWRAGRDAAANEAALYGCSEGSDEYTKGVHEGYTDAVSQIVDGIRALPEPKETSHD